MVQIFIASLTLLDILILLLVNLVFVLSKINMYIICKNKGSFIYKKAYGFILTIVLNVLTISGLYLLLGEKLYNEKSFIAPELILVLIPIVLIFIFSIICGNGFFKSIFVLLKIFIAVGISIILAAYTIEKITHISPTENFIMVGLISVIYNFLVCKIINKIL